MTSIGCKGAGDALSLRKTGHLRSRFSVGNPLLSGFVILLRRQESPSRREGENVIKICEKIGIKIRQAMETVKQKFTVEFEYPVMDEKVTAEELRGIIGIGLKCFGWDIKVEEEEL